MCTSFPTLLVSLPNLASILAGYIPLSWTNRLVSVNELLNSRGGRTLLFVVDETFLYMFMLYISLVYPYCLKYPLLVLLVYSLGSTPMVRGSFFGYLGSSAGTWPQGWCGCALGTPALRDVFAAPREPPGDAGDGFHGFFFHL